MQQSRKKEFQKKKEKKPNPTPASAPALFPDLWPRPASSLVLDSQSLSSGIKSIESKTRKPQAKAQPLPQRQSSDETVIDVPSEPPPLEVRVRIPSPSSTTGSPAEKKRSSIEGQAEEDDDRWLLVSGCVDDEFVGKTRVSASQSQFLSSPSSFVRQTRPTKRRIKFRPEFLLSCSGFIESLIVLLLLVVCLTTGVNRDCSLRPSGGEQSCLWPHVLVLVSAVSAVLVSCHLLLYVFRVVVRFPAFPWQLTDSLVFALLFLVFAVVAGVVFARHTSLLLMVAASHCVLVSLLFLLLSSNRLRRHVTRKPVQVFDDEDDFFRLKRRLRFQEINNNIRRYWLL